MDKILKIFKGIWNFLNSKVFLYIVIIAIAIWLANTCSSNHDLKIDKKLAEQNLAAKNDSILMEKKKNGEMKGSITAYVSSIDSLKNLNRGLYDQVKEQKSEVISLTNTVIQLKQDTADLRKHLRSVLGPVIKLNDSTYTMDWELRYNWDDNNFDIFKGKTKIEVSFNNNTITSIKAKILLNDLPIDSIFNKKMLYSAMLIRQLDTRLTERTSQINLTFGEEVKDNKLRVFIESKYPGFSVKSMEGYFIDPNTDPYIKSLMKKRQFLPGTWSFGVGASSGYNILTAKPYLGVGVNVSYTLYQW